MNTPNENGTPGDIGNLLKPKSDGCDAGCGCHASRKPGNKSWVIGVIVLAAAGVLAARAVIKTNDVAPKAAASEFASLATLTGGSAKSPGAAAPTTEKSMEAIGALAELNTVATNLVAVFVFLPGKAGATADSPAATMNKAVRAIEAQGKKVGLFTLKASSADYDQLTGKITFPSVLAAVKGRGMVTVAGDITETKLVQGYVTASSAGGCGPASGGCAPGACK